MSQSDPEPFNFYLRRLRRERGWTLRDVEKITSGLVSNAYLSQLEGGKIDSPSLRIIHQLSAAYGIDFEDFAHRALNGKEPLPPVPVCPTCGRPYERDRP